MILPVKTTRDLLVQSTADEAVVYHQPSHRVHRLSRSAVFVWNRCDGVTTVRQAADELSKVVGRPVQDEVIEFAVENLVAAGLVEAAEPASPSRRSMLRRLGWTGAAAALLPLVTAMLSPQPAAASSQVVAPPNPCVAPNNRPEGCPCTGQGQAQCAEGLFCAEDTCQNAE